MKTYDYYAEMGADWIDRNIRCLCGNCEMIRAPEYDYQSDAYIADGYVLHINHSACDTIENRDEDNNVLEEWRLDN